MRDAVQGARDHPSGLGGIVVDQGIGDVIETGIGATEGDVAGIIVGAAESRIPGPPVLRRVSEKRPPATAAGDDVIYRLGDRTESPSRLSRKSAEAEEALGVHGVSGSTTRPSPGTPCSSASCSALEAAGFPVHRTPSRRDPGHVTIELPNPVTKEVADTFNEVFGR